MTSRKFFSVLWRVNAVVIFAVGALGCVVLAIAMYALYKDATRERRVHDVLNVTDQTAEDDKTTLSDFEAIDGSIVLRASLEIEQSYSVGSGSKSADSTRNYLFFDPMSDAAYWLIQGFKGIITTTTELPGDDQPVKAVFYELIEQDSNHDGRLTVSDLKDVALSDPAGTRLTRVLTGIETLHGVHLLPNSTEAIVLYTSGGSPQAAHVDISTGKILRKADLQPPKDPTA